MLLDPVPARYEADLARLLDFVLCLVPVGGLKVEVVEQRGFVVPALVAGLAGVHVAEGRDAFHHWLALGRAGWGRYARWVVGVCGGGDGGVDGDGCGCGDGGEDR